MATANRSTPAQAFPSGKPWESFEPQLLSLKENIPSDVSDITRQLRVILEDADILACFNHPQLSLVREIIG